ncbi:MAG: GNAT family N-acetyltransferase [Ginsengibacter sp.]
MPYQQINLAYRRQVNNRIFYFEFLSQSKLITFIPMISWQCKYFTDLTNLELYKILQLRNEVFVVEQHCAYQDCDDKDLKAYHLMVWQDENLIAYTRLLAKGISYADAASIGRVLTSPSSRKKNIGKELMQKSIAEIYRLFGQTAIKVSAQFYLKKFYESFGFVQQSEIYHEDGIEHIRMELKINRAIN